ncbi:hypothetical protein BKP37_07225 [Anaerobacillus alkalilacustris]|uniref:Thioredoxin domain-containing protein n=1 Tax=Anaerobacillus alkalilacustris TaxID=393763 RepID=A0A1S2LR11_9BACI|nr:TlpA disulfide reductase family protein [Anaerobacillus alkalilacustris]OIJ14764.1 hypothetical protein BKP37_07225 [Anaerobacillus alkalilacustris]
MKAPDFILKKMGQEEEVSLHSYVGKPILLTFWTSWCPDSQKDLYIKNQFYGSMKNNNLILLTINVTGREGNKDAGLKFMERENYSFPALEDEGTKTYDAYRCMGVPTTILISKEHDVVATYNDKVHFTEVLKNIGKIL